MKKAIAKILLFILAFALLLTGCTAEFTQGVARPTPGASTNQTVTDPNGQVDENPFTVTLTYMGQVYIPTVENPISVLWNDGYSVYEAQLGPDGVARIGGLDGDYKVTVTNIPEGFTYNPNIYVADNNSRHVEIKLHKIIETTGRGLDEWNCIRIKNTGLYCIKVNNAEQMTYFEYTPSKNGVYTVESWMDVTANEVNPIAYYHGANPMYKPLISTHDTGGYEGSYTKNFKLDVQIAEENISKNDAGSVAFTFGISATQKSGKYPIYVYISITRDGDYDYDHVESEIMVPKVDLQALANKLSGKDENGQQIPGAPNLFEPYGSFHWAETSVKGGGLVFDADNYKLNPATGVYHKYDPVRYAANNGFGPVLFAKISKPTRFLSGQGGVLIAISDIEDAGNKALTVDNGEHNYKMFIEGWAHLNSTGMYYDPVNGKPPYFCNFDCPCRQSNTCTSVELGFENGTCDISCEKCSPLCRKLPKEAIGAMGYEQACNSDGAFPVTEELKEFLQRLSISQLYFMDGQGWVETHPDWKIFATEDDQWLWACGYYE